MKWITRERPKIDRIACPWLIKHFVDKEAEFMYVPAEQVKERAQAIGAIPFDIPDVEFSHHEDKCTFDYIIEKYSLTDPALQTMALIVRGADTDRHDIASQAAGLWAISAGLAYNIQDDYELLQKGMMLYDALYNWAKYLQKVKHTQNPVDHVFIDVYNKFIKQQSAQKKTPAWVKELKQIIQDQIDSNINLTQISKSLDINPSYLSREFSKHFNNLSFGEYIRKLRIEKAIELMQQNKYTLTEIAYLTGFSDQSHFTRIFKQHTGKSPSLYKKEWDKSKKDTKG
ncbi:helix-turn-helix domain-containing protein [Ilyomonas limi]|uniref:Helix-turn-helix domain-containing protein n=1 Tax=Ilyomonas limi TaxID=2575867 RepID=A0A4U3LC33_9BACT|nr:chromate resistance protein ChrB domain-containing protein [Ilyomonas limi]TKK71626.1 helix-turn-helix domain-containing protein [Ilyomonas limi]